MSNKDSIRRANLRVIVQQWGGLGSLAKKLKLSGASYISQLVNGKRPFTEKTARKYEKQLGLEEGWLDAPHDGTTGPVPVSIELMMQVVTTVAEALEAEGVRLPPAKFADAVAMAYERQHEHGSLDHVWLLRVIKLAR